MKKVTVRILKNGIGANIVLEPLHHSEEYCLENEKYSFDVGRSALTVQHKNMEIYLRSMIDWRWKIYVGSSNTCDCLARVDKGFYYKHVCNHQIVAAYFTTGEPEAEWLDDIYYWNPQYTRSYIVEYENAYSAEVLAIADKVKKAFASLYETIKHKNAFDKLLCDYISDELKEIESDDRILDYAIEFPTNDEPDYEDDDMEEDDIDEDDCFVSSFHDVYFVDKEGKLDVEKSMLFRMEQLLQSFLRAENFSLNYSMDDFLRKFPKKSLLLKESPIVFSLLQNVIQQHNSIDVNSHPENYIDYYDFELDEKVERRNLEKELLNVIDQFICSKNRFCLSIQELFNIYANEVSVLESQEDLFAELAQYINQNTINDKEVFLKDTHEIIQAYVKFEKFYNKIVNEFGSNEVTIKFDEQKEKRFVECLNNRMVLHGTDQSEYDLLFSDENAIYNNNVYSLYLSQVCAKNTKCAKPTAKNMLNYVNYLDFFIGKLKEQEILVEQEGQYQINNFRRINSLPKNVLYFVDYCRCLNTPTPTGESLIVIINKEVSKSSKRRSVLQLDDDGNVIEEFPTILEAAKSIGVSTTGISYVLSGKQHRAAGYKWKYKE